MYALKNFVPLLRTAQRALMIQWQQTRHVDYYSALGVSLQSDVQEIKVAYFRLAKRYHPDHNRSPDAESMFELVSEAYEVLSDPVKRKNFDEYGTAGETFGGSTAKGPGRKKGDKTFTSEDLFDRIFKAEGDKRSLFGTEQAYHDGSEFGHDSTKDLVLTVTFEEAAKGCLYSLQFNQKVVCYKCFGSKSEMGYQGNTCPYCEGTGLETEKVGHITTRRACSYCDGSRIFIKFKCHECCGTGVTVAAIPIMVPIPPGTENGEMFKLPIEPKLLEVSVGTDKFFFVKVLVHKSAVFERKGLDIYTKADVSVSQALRGGQVEVRGLHDYKLMVDLPSSGVSSHQNITVDGKGIKLMDSTLVGDHHIEVGINIEELTKADDEMLKALALAHGDPQDAVQEDEADIVIPVVSGRLFKAANIDNRK